MKKLALVLLSSLLVALLLIGVLAPKPAVVLKSDYLKLKDSIETLKIQQIHSSDYIADLKDSISILNDSIKNLMVRPMMTKDQFLQLYKYERLKRYFDICEKNPSQKKYLWGWGRRVFGYR